jgi:hypothetical protein
MRTAQPWPKYDSASLWADELHAIEDEATYDSLTASEAYLDGVHDWSTASSLLAHFLDASGSPVQISPQQMLHDIPGFQNLVSGDVAQARQGKDVIYSSGWQSTSVAKLAPKINDAEQNWYYALNGFQYSVQAVDNGTSTTVTVDVFKRYNWGNISGGEHRGNIAGVIPQNSIAQLNTDGWPRSFSRRHRLTCGFG